MGSVEVVIRIVMEVNFDVVMIVKFMVFVGFIKDVKVCFGFNNIIFLFEFLCEGKVFYDNFYLSCIIVGECSECVEVFVKLF